MKSRTAEKNSEQLKQLFGKNPDSLLFSRIADLYRKEGDVNRAIELCQKGIEVHPDYVTGRIILGRCYVEKENYDSAIDEFISVCKLDRKNTVAIKMLADVFVKRGETGKAGDLYRILTHLDPFDASFKILASRFDTTGKKDLLDILGVQPVVDTGFSNAPSIEEPQPYSEDFSGDVGPTDQFSAGEDNFGNGSVDQMLSSFAEEEPVSSNDTDFRMSGSDIDDRMNTLFGEQEQTPSPSLLSGITEQQSLDSEISSLVSDDSSSVEPVSGSDISSRIDELFDAPDNTASEPDSDPRGDITEKIFIDKGFASELKQLHSEQLAFENTDDSEPGAVISDNISESHEDVVNEQDDLTDSFSDNVVPFSNDNSDNDLLTDEFEETLQFDRSMFSRLNDEPDYEELVSSSPFASMGKTEELFQDQEIKLVDNKNQNETIEENEISDNAREHSSMSPLDYLSQNVFSDEIDKDVENIQPDSPSDIVSENTVLDGGDHTYQEHIEESGLSDDDGDESGFISGEHVSDKLDTIFGDNTQSTSEIPENPQEITDSSVEDESIDAIEDESNLAVTSSLIVDAAADSPEFETPDLVADFALDGIDVSEENNEIGNGIQFENIPDIDSSFIPSEENIFTKSNEEEVRDTSEDKEISNEFDIFDDLPATLETIRKSDVDKIRGLEQEIESVENEEPKPEIVVADDLIDEGGIEQHALIIENDSKNDIVEAGICDTDVSLSESVTDLSGIEDHLQIDDPVLIVDSGSHDIIIDNEDGVVSDMDVLVVSPEDEQMTGDDVADKIQDIFDLADSSAKKHFSVDESSLELVEDSDDDPVDVEPEETMILIDDSAEESNGISGSDVEERIDEYFGNDILGDSSMNKLVPEDDEAEETLIQDFYTLSGENTATASGNENLDGVDEVEIDHTVDFVHLAKTPADKDKQGIS